MPTRSQLDKDYENFKSAPENSNVNNPDVLSTDPNVGNTQVPKGPEPAPFVNPPVTAYQETWAEWCSRMLPATSVSLNDLKYWFGEFKYYVSSAKSWVSSWIFTEQRTPGQRAIDEYLKQRKEDRRAFQSMQRQAQKQRQELIEKSYNRDIAQLEREKEMCYQWYQDQVVLREDVKQQHLGQAMDENNQYRPALDINENESYLRYDRIQQVCSDLRNVAEHSMVQQLQLGAPAQENCAEQQYKDELERTKIERSKELDNFKNLQNQLIQENEKCVNENKQYVDEYNRCLNENLKLNEQIKNLENISINNSSEKTENRTDNKTKPISMEDMLKNNQATMDDINQRLAKVKQEYQILSSAEKFIVKIFQAFIWPVYLFDKKAWIWTALEQQNIKLGVKAKLAVTILTLITWITVLKTLITEVIKWVFDKKQKRQQEEEILRKYENKNSNHRLDHLLSQLGIRGGYQSITENYFENIDSIFFYIHVQRNINKIQKSKQSIKRRLGLLKNKKTYLKHLQTTLFMVFTVLRHNKDVMPLETDQNSDSENQQIIATKKNENSIDLENQNKNNYRPVELNTTQRSRIQLGSDNLVMQRRDLTPEQLLINKQMYEDLQSGNITEYSQEQIQEIVKLKNNKKLKNNNLYKRYMARKNQVQTIDKFKVDLPENNFDQVETEAQIQHSQRIARKVRN